MVINVPLSIFKGRTAAFKEPEASRFWEVLDGRYPWLNQNKLDVVKEETIRTMAALLDLESPSVERARKLFRQGKDDAALELMQEHLSKQPEDVDAIQLRGEIMLSRGNSEAGFREFSRARSLLRSSAKSSNAAERER
jgi:Flp pilus assembly protein TadD